MLSARSEADQTGESGSHWLTVRLYMLEDLLGAEGDASREREDCPPYDVLCPVRVRRGVGDRGFVSSTGGVRLMNSWNGGTVCSRPARDDFELPAVVKGGRLRVGGIVCSMPVNDEADELADRRGGLCKNVPVGAGSCGIAHPAVSP